LLPHQSLVLFYLDLKSLLLGEEVVLALDIAVEVATSVVKIQVGVVESTAFIGYLFCLQRVVSEAVCRPKRSWNGT
jgi:hypothetical protein